ncbi:type III-B CRISPR module-associated protein Cmr3 [Methylocaldum szegediense]|uniref:CRISPR-associated protein Cmr3 n=1 Tax=Methylocaldum szegediense TaxID=73780 RepID=A0ABM9HYX6_9GAMM|nr:type III-B CRISPR module-associated protein Cmr3 [Methylocaldum szegediense]CAI8771584.1 CRISPR-associated protein Cmr3 [Methylocaldum szegediense]
MNDLFLEPLDVLYLRGNKLFDGAGAHGEALMPPWPSLAAGAIRSRMLADAGSDPNSFANGDSLADPALREALGTPTAPGSFRIASFTLARSTDGRLEPFHPLPADVVITQDDASDAAYLEPKEPPPGVRSGYPLPRLPALCTDGPAKPKGGFWLNQTGWQAYLRGDLLGKDHFVSSATLWKHDPRLGIALEPERAVAAEGRLYTAETVSLCENVGFLVRIAGADSLLPSSGLVRLGGDGRAAAVRPADIDWPEPDWEGILRDRRFRLVLTSPGLFEDGWRLPGTDGNNRWRGPGGCSARLVSAAISRHTVVSGWDLARGQPKQALRAVPVGSVYWLDEFEGKAEDLRKLAESGFWCLSEYPDRQRKAEGFNNAALAAWPHRKN